MLLHKYFYIYTNAPTKCLQKRDLDSQKEEITQVFVNKSMGGKNVANPYNERLFSH